MSKQRCQEETTSTEFLQWIQYLDDQINAFHREDYFLANIAKVLVQANVKDPKKVKLEDYLVKFKKAIPVSRQKKLNSMKNSFAAWLGIKKK